MKKGEQRSPFAEREGFEPPVPLSTTVFKTVVIDHSTISPKHFQAVLFEKRVQRYKVKLRIAKAQEKNIIGLRNFNVIC